MTTWRISGVDTLCGSCGATIPKGAKLQLIALEQIPKPKKRCVLCATETPPAVIADTHAPRSIPPAGRQARMFSTKDLARDFKTRQSGS